MFIKAYAAAFKTIAKKPFMLWGLSLLSGIVCTIATLVCGILGFVGVAFGYVVSVGMAKVYLDGLEGKEVNSDQLFSGFTGRVFRVAGGMAWKDLWTLIWAGACIGAVYLLVILLAAIGLSFGYAALIVFIRIGYILAALVYLPILFFYIMKTYSYSFVPYILASRPEVTATQALRLSIELTERKRLWMWLADIVYYAAIVVVTATLFLLNLIPYVGFLFRLVLIVWLLVVFAFGPLFQGLYKAEFYRIRPTPKAPKAPKAPNYGAGGGYNPYAPNNGGYAPNGYAPQPNPNGGYAPQPNPNGGYAPQTAPQPNYNPNPNPAPNQGYNPINR